MTTPHFEMYTDNSEKQASKTLERFEQVRFFFLQRSSHKQQREERVRVVAFSSERDYKPYRVSSGAFAYYMQSRGRDYIVMQDIQPEHQRVAVHEYTHLILRHTKTELPIWLNEGLADVYSSLEPRGAKSLVGRPLPDRMESLFRQSWMDWDTLFAVEAGSPYYNRADKMAIFYAQSWLVTHMLALGPDYMPRFARFLSVVADGKPTPEALREVYGKTVSEIGRAADLYARRASVQGALFDIALEKSSLDVQASELSSLQVNLVTTELLAARNGAGQEARKRLKSLADEYPKNAEVQEMLGYVALRQEENDEARRAFASALELGSANPDMIYQLASLEYKAGIAPEIVSERLRKVVALQPDHIEARLSCAELETMQGQYGSALGMIAGVKHIEPEQAFRFYSLSAFVRWRLNDVAGARVYGEKALGYSKTAEDRSQVEELLAGLPGSSK